MATLSTETPVTPLRQRMLDDMAMRSMRSRTQHDYVRHVRAFAAFLRRSPETATAEDVRRYQLHQREHGVGESVVRATVSALRFLFEVTLDRPDLSRKLVLAPRPRKLPDVLTKPGALRNGAPFENWELPPRAVSTATQARRWRRRRPAVRPRAGGRTR